MSSLMLESPSYEVTDLLDFGPRAQERQPRQPFKGNVS
jgi:hypothetical protein